MKNCSRVEDVFKNFPEDLKSKIFAVAEGKLVYFPRNHNRKRIIDSDNVLIRYSTSKKSFSQIGDELGVTKVRIFQIIDC